MKRKLTFRSTALGMVASTAGALLDSPLLILDEPCEGIQPNLVAERGDDLVVHRHLIV